MQEGRSTANYSNRALTTHIAKGGDTTEVRYDYDITTTRWWMAVWLSGNALASINVVALRQTRLVPGWVTVCGRVNHLDM